jgi:hypothetical protein
MKTRSSPSQLSSKKGYGAIAVSQASGVKDTVQLTLISVRFRRATQRSGRARSVRGFGGPSPVKSGEVARGPETTPWLVGGRSLRWPAPRGSLRHKVNLCSHPRWPPAAGEGSRTCACERGGKLWASIAVCLKGITPRPFEYQQTSTTIPNISASAPAPAAPFPSQIPSERASGGQRSSHPAHYQGNRPGPRPHEHPVAQ